MTELAHLAASLRSVCPTAMGLIPPPFLPKGIKVAPKKKGRSEAVVFPSNTRFTIDVRAWRSSLPTSQQRCL